MRDVGTNESKKSEWVMVVVALGLGILVALAATLIFSTKAQAQTAQVTAKTSTAAKSVVIPEQFKAIFDGYRGWKTKFPDIPYSNSVSNWALRAHELATSTLRAAARNWLFMQTEERFSALLVAHLGDIKAHFGTIYLASGVHIVFSTPFTEEVDQAYRSWFVCMGPTKWHADYPHPVGEDVLRYLSNDRGNAGIGNECRQELKVLSLKYGVEELTADDLHAVGFLSRRHLANQKNSKFLKAEFIRKAIGDLFDPNT